MTTFEYDTRVGTVMPDRLTKVQLKELKNYLNSTYSPENMPDLRIIYYEHKKNDLEIITVGDSTLTANRTAQFMRDFPAKFGKKLDLKKLAMEVVRMPEIIFFALSPA